MLATAPKYYAEQQHLSALAVRQLRGASSISEVLRLLAVYQATAALLALEHGAEALREQNIPDSGPSVNPTAFTVIPSAPSVLDDVDSGYQFDRIVASLVADSGRSAMGAYAASRDADGIGHIRELRAPSCARCAILAGRWYRWSEGFQRHPRCDCTMIVARRSVATRDPFGAFERGEIGSYRTMPDGSRRFEQGLTRAQRQAVEDGADISQVVNASKGMQTVSFAGRRVRVTTEGTTSRALAFRPLSSRGTRQVDAGFASRITASGPEARRVTQTVARAPRLTPEAIYRISPNDREQAIRLLRANGYIL